MHLVRSPEFFPEAGIASGCIFGLCGSCRSIQLVCQTGHYAGTPNAVCSSVQHLQGLTGPGSRLQRELVVPVDLPEATYSASPVI